MLDAPALPPPRGLDELLDAALAAPIGATLPRISPSDRVTVIVSAPTRKEPRAEMLAALRRHLPAGRWPVAVATGTHGPCDVAARGIAGPVINHDGASDIVDLGATRRGTPVRVHRCLVETDHVLATGCIRPHYFAGFGAGAKALFPGLGERVAIRINHRLKTEERARAGIVDGNPCRDDLEEAARMVRAPAFLLNCVAGPDDRIHAAVAGDLVLAFRAGAARGRPWSTVRAPRSPLVVASDALPVTATLYQAAKIAAAAAPLVADGGCLLLVAECGEGTGPLDVVNEAIFRIGVLPRLPRGASIGLVSALPSDVVERTLLSAVTALPPLPRDALVLPRASQLLCEASS